MEDIFREGYLEEILPTIRKAAGNTPLLFTFRTKKEGGNMAASLLQYKDLVKKAICSSLVDLVDIELFSGREGVEELVALAKEKNVKTIFSNHDFFKTPSENEILSILKQMDCKDRCYANMYRRYTYSSFCHLQSKKRTFLSCYHYVYGESRTDQPLKRGSIWLLSYLWRCRKYFRTWADQCLKASFCTGNTS